MSTPGQRVTGDRSRKGLLLLLEQLMRCSTGGNPQAVSLCPLHFPVPLSGLNVKWKAAVTCASMSHLHPKPLGTSPSCLLLSGSEGPLRAMHSLTHCGLEMNIARGPSLPPDWGWVGTQTYHLHLTCLKPDPKQVLCQRCRKMCC